MFGDELSQRATIRAALGTDVGRVLPACLTRLVKARAARLRDWMPAEQPASGRAHARVAGAAPPRRRMSVEFDPVESYSVTEANTFKTAR